MGPARFVLLSSLCSIWNEWFMKLTTFMAEDTVRIGLVVQGGLVDATRRLEGECCLAKVLQENKLQQLATFTAAPPDYLFEDIQLLPPIPRPQHILAVGVNYDAHRLETGRAKSPYPTLFVRWPSSIVGSGQPIVRPSVSKRFDFEGELAVVIGRSAYRVSRDQALSYIVGYSCFQDGSIRDFQRHTSQFTPGKNFDKTGGFGPWITTSDEISDPSSLTLTTRINGEVVQHASISDLIFDIPELIEYITTFVRLEPGDVIATGTPSGVGDKRTPPKYLQPGDLLEVDISQLGILKNPVIDEAVSSRGA